MMAKEMVALLRSPERRRELGSRLHSRVNQTYSAGNVMLQISAIYDAALGQSSDPRHLQSEMYVGSIANPIGKPKAFPNDFTNPGHGPFEFSTTVSVSFRPVRSPVHSGVCCFPSLW